MKEATLDGYNLAINKVVDYINLHLFDNPDLKKLSEVANISEFHFHRVFKAIIGENVGEYIGRLRLEYVAERLQVSDETLTDIAIRSGYGTKSALSRAFKKHFGVSPSVFRSQIKKNTFKFFSRSQKSIVPLTPVVKEMEAKKIVYVRIVDWYGSPEAYLQAWKSLGQFAQENNLVDRNTEFIGLSFDNPTITEPQNCRFYACFTISKEVKPSGIFGVQTIKGGLYAIFIHKGPYEKLLDTYYNIFLQWLPTSIYVLRNGCCYEKYLNSPNQASSQDILTEIYVPIKKKKTFRK